MDEHRLFRLWCGFSAVAAASVLFSIWLVDGPVARFCQDAIDVSALKKIAPSSHQIVLGLLAGAVAVGLLCFLKKRFPGWAEAILLSAVAAAVSSHLTSQFIKPLFARPGPRLFAAHLRNHFGWHNQGLVFSAFPSTHAALAAGGLSVLGLYFPRARISCVLGVLAIDALLVVGGWHFISDVLAGNIVGFTIAALACGTAAALKARWDAVT